MEISNLERGLARVEQKIDEIFGDLQSINLATAPLETLEAMKSWLAIQLNYLYPLKAQAEDDWESSKIARDEVINEKFIEHLSKLEGQGKVGIAERYAKQDAKEYIRGVAVLHAEYNKRVAAVKSFESMQKSIIQTISTVNKEKSTQQFIQGSDG